MIHPYAGLVRHRQAITDSLEDLKRRHLSAAVNDLIDPPMRYPRDVSQADLANVTIALHQPQRCRDIARFQRAAQIVLMPRRCWNLHRANDLIGIG